MSNILAPFSYRYEVQLAMTTTLLALKYAPGTTHNILARSNVRVPLKANRITKGINTHGS